MPDEERRRRVAQAIAHTITRTSARDEQKSVGPSEIGDPCGFCLGRALCRKYPELWWGDEPLGFDGDTFSLKAWVGTAMHEKLERELDEPGALKESTIHITDLAEYGPITGHCDLYMDHTVIDYKSKDNRDVIRKIALTRPKDQEIFQINTYGFGFLQAGVPVKDLCLFYIPRDSNRVKDCYPAFTEPNPKIAEMALDRLSKVWDIVRSGRGSVLESLPDCYTCNIRYYLPQ